MYKYRREPAGDDESVGKTYFRDTADSSFPTSGMVSQRIEAGNVYVNKWFGDTNQTPFGGDKQSGIGREKEPEALDSYFQPKNVAIDVADEETGSLPGA